MTSILEKILTQDENKRFWISIALTVVLAGLISLVGIYIIKDYGIAIFLMIPFFIGASSTIFYGYKRTIKKKQYYLISISSLFIYALSLLVFAIEGIICIIMAMPLAAPMVIIGSWIGQVILEFRKNQSTKVVVLLLFAIPIFSFIEKKIPPTINSVITSVEIDADIENVWKNVIEFSTLDEPSELLFKIGIAYPTDAQIDGIGVGAVRHCNFTTGSFVEPITTWEPPTLLQFDVLEQPAPLREISFWDIDAPHLHDYFVSKKGQFKLSKLPNGKVLLEGTTWYYHDIKPAIYWKLWSNFIVHKIHHRVLNHIKVNSEKN